MKRILLINILIFLSAIHIFSAVEDRIDLNKTDTRELMLLPGFTEELAAEVIEYRNQKGGFKDVEELLPIIGEILYEKIRYDVFVTPPEVLAQGEIDGNLSIELARDYKYYKDSSGFNASLKVDVGDTFDLYLAQEDHYIYYDEIKTTDTVIHDFTYFIYDFEKAVPRERNIFEPKVFQKITVDEQKKKYEDIIRQLEEKYDRKLSVKEDNDYVTGYYESNPSVSGYLRHPDTKRLIGDEDKKTFIHVDDSTEYSRQNIEATGERIEEKVLKEEQEAKEERENQRNLYRRLKYKIDSGFLYIPYVRSAKYGSKGQGWSVENYFGDNTFQMFYLENSYYSHEDPVYGFRLETDMKDSRVGLVTFKLDNRKTGNEFDNFMLYGEKDVDKKSSLYMEYGQIANINSTFYIKGFTEFKKLNITTSLRLQRDNCDDYSKLEPFGQNYYSTAVAVDMINPYIKFDYFLPKGNKLTFMTEHNEYSSFHDDNGLQLKESRFNGLKYKYNISDKMTSEFYFAFKRNKDNQSSGADDGSLVEETTNQIILDYELDDECSMSFKFKRENESTRPGEYDNVTDFRLYKDFGKNT
ncbi:MAG: ComEA family DNA-binding protein, partial [Candidatus Muiribacteriaceae bacterium]